MKFPHFAPPFIFIIILLSTDGVVQQYEGEYLEIESLPDVKDVIEPRCRGK
jgi:hypothetical protein